MKRKAMFWNEIMIILLYIKYNVGIANLDTKSNAVMAVCRVGVISPKVQVKS